MRRLIVNADDFGLTAGVNRAVLELHHAGVVTSTTLMARAKASEEAICMAIATPSLGVGCHVVLVDGDPVLQPKDIPSLIDARTGRFLSTLGAFLVRLLSGRLRAEEIESEATAQIALLQARGLQPTHIDTHKHVHLFPAVLQSVLRAARATGIEKVRNPFEPQWSVRATRQASWMRRAQVATLRRFEPAFRRIVAKDRCKTTDGALGVLATGNMTPEWLQSLSENMPGGCWELVTHPGYLDRDLENINTRLLASRERELEALMSLRDSNRFEAISFSDL